MEDIFQQFRELTYNHEDPDENFKLWGVVRIPPEEKLPSVEEAMAPEISFQVEQVEEEIEIAAEARDESTAEKTETGDPNGPATPPVR